MMWVSARSRACRSVSAMMTSRVSGHSPTGSARPAARRFSKNVFFPATRLRRVGGGPGDPVVGERGAPLQRELSPAADPHGRVGLGERLGLEPALYAVVAAFEVEPLLGPEAPP